ncbi:unnamed protein product [Pieris brassicae]|uniref:Uncharacterized protein n=1 Tax=Pieris brassicae TaxID=7116 RepID=A0A9P0TDL3_PIEBR|nr:unnamed protein product [Pieris brassicae]
MVCYYNASHWLTPLKELANKHPTAKQDLKNVLSSESSLKSISEDLLQLTCRRRAEIIEQIRNDFLPKNGYQASLMSAIPPSNSHIFYETQLLDLMKERS